MRALLALLACLFSGLALAQQDEASVSTFSYLQRATSATEPNSPIVIQGLVIERDSGDPLDYTNILVAGTNIGTVTHAGGRFWLRGLGPGRHTIKARYLGFDEGSAEIDVRPGDVVEVRFLLAIKPVRFPPMDVKAERKLVVIQETGTARRIGADELENLVQDDLEDIIAMQPGVQKHDNAIRIRGGRADDTQFYVDGVSAKDPLAAGRYGASFNEDLINEIEVLTGGFSAKYGDAASGVVRVSTKEGGRDFEGKLTYKTDRAAPSDIDYDTDQMRMTLSGPNLIWDELKAAGLPLPGEQSWIVSTSGDLSDTYYDTSSLSGPLESNLVDSFWSPRADNDWSLLAKLTWKFGDLRKLNLSYSNQQSIGLGFFLPAEGYPVLHRRVLDDWNVFFNQSIQSQANWTHVLGEGSFYEVTLSRQFSRMNSQKNGSEDFADYVGVNRNERRRGDGVDAYGNPDPTDPASQNGGTWFQGVYESGDSDRWHDHFVETWAAKADWTWERNENNRLESGVDLSLNEIQLGDYQDELSRRKPGEIGLQEDVFYGRPRVFAGYVQNRSSYQGLILNVGLRYDAWAPGPEVDHVMDNPDDYLFIFDTDAQSYHDKTFSAFGLRWKQRLSPRVGLSIPISPHDKFFFNYGHFSQWPRWNYVYSQLTTTRITRIPLLGNPDLDPKVTVQYETGVQHEFPGLWSAGITFYSNDIYGYAQSVSLEGLEITPDLTPDPNDTRTETITPVRYFNADAARAVGVELSLEKRATEFLSGRFSIELSRTTGTNGDANQNYLQTRLADTSSDFETERGVVLGPLAWDRPWSVTTVMNVAADDRDSPELFGWQTPANWNLNLVYRAWSGARYTERTQEGSDVQDSNNRNTKLGPYRSSLDIGFKRWWDLPLRQRLTLMVEAQNVLDHQNYRRINPWTGRPYFKGNWDGDIAGTRNALGGEGPDNTSQYYLDQVLDPSYLSDPRRLLVGVSWEW